MLPHTRRNVGICIGLVLAGLVLAFVRPTGERRIPAGALLADCDGAIASAVIQYTRGADFTLPVYREFLTKLPAGVTVHVACPDGDSFDELLRYVGTHACVLRPVITDQPITPWSRDRWLALQAFEPGTPGTLLCPRAELGADVWPQRKGDAAVAERVARDSPNELVWRRDQLYFDGGDFVADDTTAFVAPNVLRRNLQVTVATRQELIAELGRLLRRRIILLDRAPDHHAGMFMMTVGGNTVLVGDPSLAKDQAHPQFPGGVDFSSQTQERFDSVAHAAADADYEVVRIPLVPGTDGRTYLTYVNVIIDQRAGRRTVYMPVYAGAERLNELARETWESLGYEVRPIDCTSCYPHFGSLRCLVNVAQRRQEVELARGD